MGFASFAKNIRATPALAFFLSLKFLGYLNLLLKRIFIQISDLIGDGLNQKLKSIIYMVVTFLFNTKNRNIKLNTLNNRRCLAQKHTSTYFFM